MSSGRIRALDDLGGLVFDHPLGDTHAQRDRATRFLHAEPNRRQSLDQGLDPFERLVRGRVRQHDDELVAAVARHQVAGPERRRQRARDFGEDAVAFLMALGVVDLLEVVDVDHRQHERQPARSVRAHPLVQGPFEAAAVGDPRELVERRLFHRLRQTHLQSLDLGGEACLGGLFAGPLVHTQLPQGLDLDAKPSLQDSDVVDVDDTGEALGALIELIVEGRLAAVDRPDHLGQHAHELGELALALGQERLSLHEVRAAQLDALFDDVAGQ